MVEGPVNIQEYSPNRSFDHSGRLGKQNSQKRLKPCSVAALYSWIEICVETHVARHSHRKRRL
jgi:hypothetical protein